MPERTTASSTPGVPAEDARGLLPTNIATRLHYRTDLRNLVNTAGMAAVFPGPGRVEGGRG